jgi:hypothetical protein
MDRVSVGLNQIADAPRRLGCRSRDRDHALEEELEPLLPGSLRAHPLQVLVVGIAVLLEVQAEIEQR